MRTDLERFFTPEAIAVIGDRPGKGVTRDT
jgi:acyl-CoA synthetase (NDP forming)